MDAGPANGPGFCPEAEGVGGGWRQLWFLWHHSTGTALCGESGLSHSRCAAAFLDFQVPEASG